MAFAWIGWHDLTQEEYEQAIEARKVQRGQAQATAEGQQ